MANEFIRVEPAFLDIKFGIHSEAKQSIPITYTNNTSDEVSMQLSLVSYDQTETSDAIRFSSGREIILNTPDSPFSLDSLSIVIKPNEKRTVNFLLDDSQSKIQGGGTYVGVLATIQNEDGSKIHNTALQQQIASLFTIHKTGGEKFKALIRIDDELKTTRIHFSQPEYVTASVKNEGNIHIIPSGVVDVYTQNGDHIIKGVFNTSSKRIFPKNSYDIIAKMKKIDSDIGLGKYTMKIDLHDTLHKISHKETIEYFYIHPAYFVLLFLLIAAGILFSRKFKKRSK